MKPYTLGTRAGRSARRVCICRTTVLEQMVPLGRQPGIWLLPAGWTNQGRKPHRAADFC